MAGAGYKLFNTGDVLTAAQVNTYLMEQTVMVFADAAARTTALSGVLSEGMISYLKDTNATEVYNGSAWVGITGDGDITGVTAGTGISGGGTSGTVTITNSMATAIDAKGDLIVGTGADTFSRLAVGGTDGHVLKVKASTSTGLEWGAAASGGGMTSLATGTLSGSVVNLTSISGSYKDLKLVIRNFRPSSENDYVFYIRVNADSTANRYGTSQWDVGSSGSFNDSYWYWTYANDNATSQSYIVVDIEDYANTSTWKVASGRSVTTDPGTNTWFRWGYRNLVYNQTGAITQLNIGVTTGTFNAGDYILYGVS